MHMRNFNTSYVTVQLLYKILKIQSNGGFQYILCYGSTFIQLLVLFLRLLNFNTSYVTVQRILEIN